MRMGLQQDDAPPTTPFLQEITWTQHFVNAALVVVEGVTWSHQFSDLTLLEFLLAGHRNSRLTIPMSYNSNSS
jgi:hypothetical protein